MPLSADRALTFETTDHIATKTVAAAVTIYKGALVVSVASGGLVKPAVDETSSFFYGIAMAGAAAGETVDLITSGKVWIPKESNVDGDSIGKALYCHDDATCTETGTLGPVIGRCLDVVGSNALIWLGMPAATAAS